MRHPVPVAVAVALAASISPAGLASAAEGLDVSSLPPHVAALLNGEQSSASLVTTPTLAGAVAAFAADLGVPVPASVPAGRAPAVDAWLTRIVSIAHRCHSLRGHGADLVPKRAECARLLAAGAAVTSALASELWASDGAIDAWPVLRFEPGRDSTVYEHDYAVLVDRGGEDVYDNNAGSNLLDLKRGPQGSAAPVKGPARGCEAVFFDTQTGTGPIPGPDCVNAASLLVDLGGDDRYGVVRERGDTDRRCGTEGMLVRRIATGGVGVAGVGVLVDGGGDDVYSGKTLTLGTGHLGGVGMLVDRGGDDSYQALRFGQGVGVLSGVGVLVDDGGDDVYDFAVPTGGVLNDAPPPFQVCDASARSLQGFGTLSGIGILLDRAGDDRRRGPAPPIVSGKPHVTSQGAGRLAGSGVLADLRGDDAYTTDAGPSLPGREDGRVTLSGTGGDATGPGVFVDTRNG